MIEITLFSSFKKLWVMVRFTEVTSDNVTYGDTNLQVFCELVVKYNSHIWYFLVKNADSSPT